MKKQPQRTCIACRQTATKRQLVRLVHTPAGEISIDPKGKLAGRGAYLHAYQECWMQALKARMIGPALKATVSEEDYARLEAYARQLPERPSEAPSSESTVT